MNRDEEVVLKVSRLADLEVEYDATIRVLAAIVELFLQVTGSTVVVLSDALLADPPDLDAWRSPEDCTTTLKASRDAVDARD